MWQLTAVMWQLTYFDLHTSRRVVLTIEAANVFEAIWFARQRYSLVAEPLGCDHCAETGRFKFVESKPVVASSAIRRQWEL